MNKLADSLLADGRRNAVIADCADLIDTHVKRLRGIKGIALRSAFTMLRGGEPNAVHNAVANLIPEFVHAFEPLYRDFRKGTTGGFGDYLRLQRPRAVEAMLSVTDARFARSQNAALKRVYPKVRGTVEKELDGILPELAGVLERHIAD
jgi:hypothetical protein